MRTAHETAVLLAAMLNRSGQKRARISLKTLKLLGRRQNLRSAFVVEVTQALADFDWCLVELKSGFGAVQISALEASKGVTYRARFTDEERRTLRQGQADWPAFEAEAAGLNFEEPEEEE